MDYEIVADFLEIDELRLVEKPLGMLSPASILLRRWAKELDGKTLRVAAYYSEVQDNAFGPHGILLRPVIEEDK